MVLEVGIAISDSFSQSLDSRFNFYNLRMGDLLIKSHVCTRNGEDWVIAYLDSRPISTYSAHVRVTAGTWALIDWAYRRSVSERDCIEYSHYPLQADSIYIEGKGALSLRAVQRGAASKMKWQLSFQTWWDPAECRQPIRSSYCYLITIPETNWEWWAYTLWIIITSDFTGAARRRALIAARSESAP